MLFSTSSNRLPHTSSHCTFSSNEQIIITHPCLTNPPPHPPGACGGQDRAVVPRTALAQTLTCPDSLVGTLPHNPQVSECVCIPARSPRESSVLAHTASTTSRREPEQARSLAESKCGGGSGAGGGGDGGGGGGGDSMQPKSRSSTTSLIVASCDYPVRLIVEPHGWRWMLDRSGAWLAHATPPVTRPEAGGCVALGTHYDD